MKACLEYLEMMNAVLDGEASPAEQAELTAHLEHCPACAALFEDLRALHEGADTLTVSAPAGFADRVMDAVRAESARPALKVLPTPKRRKRWMPVAAMAAVCALALIGSGSLLGVPVFTESYTPVIMIILPAGGFLTLGILMAVFQYFTNKYNKKEEN